MINIMIYMTSIYSTWYLVPSSTVYTVALLLARAIYLYNCTVYLNCIYNIALQ